jgi:hypothetical protein
VRLFLLPRPRAGKPAARAYCACATSATPETFLTVHHNGKFRAFPYVSFLLFQLAGGERQVEMCVAGIAFAPRRMHRADDRHAVTGRTLMWTHRPMW